MTRHMQNEDLHDKNEKNNEGTYFGFLRCLKAHIFFIVVLPLLLLPFLLLRRPLLSAVAVHFI